MVKMIRREKKYNKTQGFSPLTAKKKFLDIQRMDFRIISQNAYICLEGTKKMVAAIIWKKNEEVW